MGYVHALEILPEELIEKIQEYVDGQVIYIPKIKSKRCKWGEKTDTNAYFKERNFEIYNGFKNGMTISELSEKYFLTTKSIQRIIRSMRILWVGVPLYKVAHLFFTKMCVPLFEIGNDIMDL